MTRTVWAPPAARGAGEGMTKEEIRVPVWALEHGASTCRAIAALDVEAAQTLLTAGLASRAAVFASLAIEELGKAVMLRDAYVSRSPRDASCRIIGFRHHDTKLAAAARFIGGEGLRFAARLDRLHVDWKPAKGVPSKGSRILHPSDEGCWTWNEAPIDIVAVQEAIRSVEVALARTALEWTSWQV